MINELKDRLREIEEAITLLGTRVPRRDYDAAIGALHVCQTTIESLMTTLFALKPKSREVANARTVLAGLEAIIDTKFDEYTADKMEGKYNYQTYKHKPFDGVFGKVKRGYK